MEENRIKDSNDDDGSGNVDDEDDDDPDESSPIAASMLGLNNIRTRSVPIELQLPSLVASFPDSGAVKEVNEDNNKRDNAAAAKKKYIFPENPLSTVDVLGLSNFSPSLFSPPPIFLKLG